MKPLFNLSLITDNYLDPRFQNVLFPYRFLQHLLFLSRFSIKYNCIRYHVNAYYLFSFFGSLCLFLYMYLTITTLSVDRTPSLNFFPWLNALVLFFPFFLFYCINIVHRKEHVEIILKIQKSFRIVKFKDYKICVMWNWFGVFSHFFWIILSLMLLQEIRIALTFYVMIFLDVNTTYGISLIFLIRNGMVAWISEVEYQCRICLELEEGQRCEVFKKLFVAYQDLMQAYAIYKKLFKIPVSTLHFCILI